MQTATDNAGYCDTALGNHDELVSGSEDLRAQHDWAERAHVVCNSGGALAMSLKRWVLTRELDRVTAAANIHLARMTAHRYSLQRKVDTGDRRRSFGLDLEVLDSTTGRPRSTSTLSGGEQFQASLALALGLADVVSHGGSASGKRFEALFVDEGFGSLDPQSLDDAIEALHQLHASGRMVGAITHVDAMKQQLHVGIEVRRLPDGAGSTLVVNP
ncbi:MAG: SMC family ATPase [Microthrixaceae bacterium]|nr:SMC family ATPase [Microthrixaceae bacterium]